MIASLNNYDKITKYIAELSRKGYTFREILEAVMFLTGYPRSEIEAVCNEMIKEEAGCILHTQPKTLTNYISNK